MAKTALITGASGQDGSYLAEQLLAEGYQVLALDRARSDPYPANLRNVQGHDRFRIIEGDLLESELLTAVVKRHQPDELYNLAAQSFVPKSWEMPIYTTEVDAVGPLRLLEAIRHHSPHTHFYQASSSEIFGKVREAPQHEDTVHHPRSPYGVAKSFGMNITRNYRESFGLFCCNGILFNHESERRGPQFVTRKISLGVAAIHSGREQELRMGNLDAKRDWGYAPDYVRAMRAILRADEADDYVVATGETHTIREFIELAFHEIGIDLEWSGAGVQETGKDGRGVVRVRIDPTFFRPAEVELLLGDSRKIQRKLGWRPEVDFKGLVRRMVRHDIALEEQRSRAQSATAPSA